MPVSIKNTAQMYANNTVKVQRKQRRQGKGYRSGNAGHDVENETCQYDNENYDDVNNLAGKLLADSDRTQTLTGIAEMDAVGLQFFLAMKRQQSIYTWMNTVREKE